MKDGSLSINAKNAKIIAQDGKVTLRGPVDNQQEKDTIGAEAGEIAGKDKVDNQLEVKAEKK
jgi:osmotically-inducible protein OsmY